MMIGVSRCLSSLRIAAASSAPSITGIIMSVSTRVDRAFREDLEGQPAIVRQRDLETGFAQHLPQQLGETEFIVDDEDRLCRLCHATPLTLCRVMFARQPTAGCHP